MAVSKLLRRDLLKQGVPEFVSAYICSGCEKSSEQMDKFAPHALQAEYETQKRRYEQTEDELEEIVMIRLSKMLKNTSRCCGLKFKKVEVSYHQILWQMWCERLERLPEKRMKKARYDYGVGEVRRSDDFIRISTLFGLSDGKTIAFVEAFGKEEARELVAA